MSNILTVLWNLQKFKIKLGNLILLNFETSLVSIKNGFEKVEMFFSGNSSESEKKLINEVFLFNPLCTKVNFVQNITFRPDNIWTNDSLNIPSSFNESTLALQKLFKSVLAYPQMQVPLSINQEVEWWLNGNALNKHIVAVHLKYPGSIQESNADVNAWGRFFSDCSNDYPDYIFILVDGKNIIKHFPYANVVCHELGLIGDLSFILKSELFLGTASGPSNMVICSQHPYVIWKHPEHHKEQMQAEQIKGEKFDFSFEKQYFVLNTYDSEGIMNYFLKVK